MDRTSIRDLFTTDNAVAPWAAALIGRLGRLALEDLRHDLALLDEGGDAPDWVSGLYDLTERELDALAQRSRQRGRPLGQATLSIRSAVFDLTHEFRVGTSFRGTTFAFPVWSRAITFNTFSNEPVFGARGLTGGEFDVLAALRREGQPYRLTPTTLVRALDVGGVPEAARGR